jgi:hypothetical protein
MRMTDLAPDRLDWVVKDTEEGSPLSMAYLMVGRAATIRYLSAGAHMETRSRQLTAGLVMFCSLSWLTVQLGLKVKDRGSLRNVKVDSDEDLLALEADVGDGELGR